MPSFFSSLVSSAVSACDAVSDRLSLYKETPHVETATCLAKQYGPGTVASATSENSVLTCLLLHVDGGRLLDKKGRKVTLKGINVDSAMKIPVTPFMPSYYGNTSSPGDIFFDGDNVSFVGRPFPLEEAEQHFRRIKSWGFNTIRYLVTWEAIEHLGPGIYDQEFINYTIEVLRILHSIDGLYVFFDCHQDVWSRFTGGSGAPMWTLYAAGMHPKRISSSGVAVLHSDALDEQESRSSLEFYPHMLWTSNYKRLALLTMFTLFFAGEAYFPDLEINGQNIQHYLQLHHINALKHLWLAVVKDLPEMVEDGTIVGFELLNEPNQGLVGHPRLDQIPDSQHLRIGTTPTVFDSLKLGMGLPVEVDTYKISISGPQKCGKEVIDPKGAPVWLSEEEMTSIDQHYGWKRSGWTPGSCIFAKMGIWSWDENYSTVVKSSNLDKRLSYGASSCKLLKPNYFNQDPGRFKVPPHVKENLSDIVNVAFFVNVCFVAYYSLFKEMIRSLCPEAFVLMQPPVLVIPPILKADPRNIIDERTIYCPHYYDGMSLMFKSWNFRFNVDTLGIMRDRYASPVLGIVLGGTAIRNCIKKQFHDISQECKDNLGDIPVLMSETGMPFDMNEKSSYKSGRFKAQTAAIDALANALEDTDMHHTYWCYTSINSHKWGDHWNNEDFSFWSKEDRDIIALQSDSGRETDRNSLSYSVESHKTTFSASNLRTTSRNQPIDFNIKPRSAGSGTIRRPDSEDSESEVSTLCTKSSSATRSKPSGLGPHRVKKYIKSCFASPDGVRAVNAVIRPYLMTSVGTRKNSSFDLKETIYELTVTFTPSEFDAAGKSPTVIFLPEWHFPKLTYSDIDVTCGYVEYDAANEQLHWYLDSSMINRAASSFDHTIIVRRFKKRPVNDGFNICG